MKIVHNPHLWHISNFSSPVLLHRTPKYAYVRILEEKIRTALKCVGCVVWMVLTTIGLSVSLLQPAYAQIPGPDPCDVDASSTLCAEQNRVEGEGSSGGLFGEGGLLVNVANIIALIGGIAAVVVITIGALRYVTAGGDPQKTSSAQKAITYAAVGLVVAGAARLIISLLLNRLYD